MKNKLELNDGKTVYEFDSKAVYEKDGKNYEFISFKKVTDYKGNKKYQNLTIQPKDWPAFCEFLEGCMENRPVGEAPDPEIPF